MDKFEDDEYLRKNPMYHILTFIIAVALFVRCSDSS